MVQNYTHKKELTTFFIMKNAKVIVYQYKKKKVQVNNVGEILRS